MFDDTPSADRGDFESWLAGELRRPAPPDPARTSRIMARVRHTAPPVRRRRPWSPPALGLAVAAGLAGLAALHPLALAARPGAADGLTRTTGAPRGDTLAAAIGSVLRDTIRDSIRETIRGALEVAVRDTTRLVHFALVAPTAARVSVAGDFNGWDPRATPLARHAAGDAWSGEVALAPGRHRYAFVVDDTQWVAGRAWPERAAPDTTN